jgi:hypothetical protein
VGLGDAILLFVCAALGGALNSVAGGGSFICFPALVFTGVPSIEANATNTVALWPGSVAAVAAYREEIVAQRRMLLILGGVSLLGGLAGAVIVLTMKPVTFERLLPWLLLAATTLFAVGGKVSAFLKSRGSTEGNATRAGMAAVCLLQFFIAVYGGFFGGGIGILMLASLSLMGMTDIHRMNALKTVLASLINGISVAVFIWYGRVYALEGTVMVFGAIIGGYMGAAWARKLDPGKVRTFVLAIGYAITAVFFYRYGF